MENKDLILKEQGQELAKILTPETIKKYICPNATEQEIYMFLQIAKMYQLNPFKREIYLVKYGDNPAQNVVGYETYLKRAERTGEWSGMKVWTEGIIPQLTAKIEINKKGWDKPFYHEVDYSEYVQHKKDGSITRFWNEKPKTMLKKVVVSQAFRMAFPDEFGGMPYTMEEMPIEIEKLSTEEIKVEEHKEPMKEAVQPIKNEQSKPANFLNVEQALTAKKAETLEGVMGLLQVIKERVTKTKKDITDYTITSMDGNSKMMISMWSKKAEGVSQGQVVIFKVITIGEYKDVLQYTAKEIEIVGHNKLEE